MEIRRLEHLVAVADVGNFHKAAERCNITQSALSRSIQAAEDEYKLQLFDRGTTRVTCTDAGKLAVERARKLLFEDRCLARDMKMFRERLIGDLSFGVGPYPTAVIAPALVVELRTQFPGVRVNVEVSYADQLVTRLRSEELDFYLADARNLVSAPDLVIQRLGKLMAGFYVRSGHPLLSVKRLLPEMLLPYGIASVRAPMELLLALGKAMGLPKGQPMALVVQCDDLSMLRKIAYQTDTVVGYPDAEATKDVEDGKLVKLQMRGFINPFSQIALASLKGRSFSPVASYAVNFLIKSI